MNKMFMTQEPVGGFRSIKEIELYEDKEWELEDSKDELERKMKHLCLDYSLYKNHTVNLANELKLKFLELFNPKLINPGVNEL